MIMHDGLYSSNAYKVLIAYAIYNAKQLCSVSGLMRHDSLRLWKSLMILPRVLGAFSAGPRRGGRRRGLVETYRESKPEWPLRVSMI